MSIKDKIESKRNLREAKEKVNEVTGKLTGKIKELAKSTGEKVSETFDAFNDVVAKQFKKDIYAKAIDYVENQLIEYNIDEPRELLISKYEEDTLTISDIIRSIGKDLDVSSYTESNLYIDNIFNVIATHFAQEEDVDCSLESYETIIRLKISEPIEEDLTEDSNINENCSCENCVDCIDKIEIKDTEE